MKRTRLKYYLRALGIGIIVTTLLMGYSQKGREQMTDEEIRRRAAQLGMVERQGVLAEVAAGTKEEEKPEESQQPQGQEEEQTAEPGQSQGQDQGEEGQTSEPQQSQEQGEEQTSEPQQPTEEGEEEQTAEPGQPQEEGEEEQTAESQQSQGQGQGEEEQTAEPGQPQEEGEEGQSAEPQQPTEEGEEGQTAEPQQPQDQGTEEPEGAAGEIFTLVINRGETSVSVSKALKEAGLVEDAQTYDRFLCGNGYDKSIHAGTYEIPLDATDEEIALIITKKR